MTLILKLFKNPFVLVNLNELYCFDFLFVYIFFTLILNFFLFLYVLFFLKEKLTFFDDFFLIYYTKEFNNKTVNFFHKFIKLTFMVFFLIPALILYKGMWYISVIGHVYFSLLVLVFLIFKIKILVYIYTYTLYVGILLFIFGGFFGYSPLPIKKSVAKIFLSEKNLEISDRVISKFLGNPWTNLKLSAQTVSRSSLMLGFLSVGAVVEQSSTMYHINSLADADIKAEERIKGSPLTHIEKENIRNTISVRVERNSHGPFKIGFKYVKSLIKEDD